MEENYPAQNQIYDMPSKKSKKLLFGAIIAFVIILIITAIILIIFSVSKKTSQQEQSPSEFPPSPVSLLPSPPSFIKLSSYYFGDLVSLKNYKIFPAAAVFAVFCGKGEQQKLIYVKSAKKGEDLSKNKDYQCWFKSCGNNQNNLYIALKWILSGSFMGLTSEQIQNIITQENNPICQNTK